MQKRNEFPAFPANKRDLKNINGRRHVFVFESHTSTVEATEVHEKIPVMIYLALATLEMAIYRVFHNC